MLPFAHSVLMTVLEVHDYNYDRGDDVDKTEKRAISLGRGGFNYVNPNAQLVSIFSFILSILKG